MRELDYIQWLVSQQTPHPIVELGIGDDAAILRLDDHAQAVVTVDMLLEGVHFDWATATPEQIGHKALAVNLSDIAAMACNPVAAFVSIGMPRSTSLEQARALQRGIAKLAAQFQVAIPGGDTNRSSNQLIISITAIGQPLPGRLPLRRSSAKVGDAILVTGSLGGSILGHHLNFTPRVLAAKILHENYALHAMIDLSDGLATDLRHILAASGCGAELWQAAIPISAAATQLSDGQSPLVHALCDGEDFELCFTAPPAVAAKILRDKPLGNLALSHIGNIVAANGLWWCDRASGQRQTIELRGYEHE